MGRSFIYGINKASIEQVLLVGGTCLIPAVQQLVTSYFGRQKVKLDKPFEAVAHGALALSKMATVDDYLRHSYAIRLWEPHSKTYSYLTLIEKGMRYPGARSQPLTLQVATQGQREIRLDIGEVIQSLENMNDPRVVDALIGMLNNDNPNVRSGTALALGNLGNSRAVEPLNQCLEDESSVVRKIAQEALNKLS